MAGQDEELEEETGSEEEDRQPVAADLRRNLHRHRRRRPARAEKAKVSGVCVGARGLLWLSIFKRRLI